MIYLQVLTPSPLNMSQELSSNSELSSNESASPTYEWKIKGAMFGPTHYVLNGPEDAPLVVTCHGIDGYHYTFDDLSVFLRGGYRVLQYDMLGRGFSSPHSSGKYTEKEHLDQLRDLLKHLQLTSSPFHLVGLSMGGSFASLYASQHPEQIKSLSLLAPAGLMNIPEVTWLRSLSYWLPFVEYLVRSHIEGQATKQELSRTFHNKTGIFKAREDRMFGAKVVANENSSTHADASWQCVMQFPLFGIDESVKNIVANKIPVHLIFGDKDVVVPYEYNFNRWKTLLDENQVAPEYSIIPNVGHNALMELPDETNDIVKNFLDKFEK